VDYVLSATVTIPVLCLVLWWTFMLKCILCSLPVIGSLCVFLLLLPCLLCGLFSCSWTGLSVSQIN